MSSKNENNESTSSKWFTTLKREIERINEDDESDLDMDLNLHDYLVKHPSATFCVKAIGDSMIDAGIKSSDVMVVDRALTPKNNDIILAIINGEFTVKRIKKNDNELYLMPANENYHPMKITKDMDFQVWGVVTFIIHKANASTSGL